MRNIRVVIKKQLKDTVKNKTIFIQFILFPLLTLIMENAVHLEDMPEHFFTVLFSVMYVGMAPLSTVASIISEEKEKNTLRVLMMANVKPFQYLVGVGVYVWMICMVGAGVISTGLAGEDVLLYLSVMGIGFLLSILAGACVGVIARNQMMATSLVMPVMMLLAFMPMLALFNDKIEKVAGVLYTKQIQEVLEKMSFSAFDRKKVAIMAVNVVILIIVFSISYKRKGLE